MRSDPSTAGAALVYEDDLALRLTAIDQLPGATSLARINETNEWLLRAIMTLTDSRELDEQEPHAFELHRIDLKLNLLMDLVAELMEHERRIPPAIHCRLSSEALSWQGEPRPAPGSLQQVELQVQPGLPRSLLLFARAAEDSTSAETRLVFEGLNQNLRDWLDRLIFRHHRRTVAQELAGRNG